MILIDTNVLSEAMRPEPDANLMNWFQSQKAEDLHVSCFVEAEMRFGIARLPEGRRRTSLEHQVEEIFETGYADQMIAVSSQTPIVFAELAAAIERKGRPVGWSDLWIAAQALEHNAVVATRNVKHFAPCGVEVVNPFETAHD